MNHSVAQILKQASPGWGAQTGSLGERSAEAFLSRKRGFHVLARNWRNPEDRREEIDLVARDGEALVFVEVKTRPEAALVPGLYAVDRRKKQVLRRAIRAYLRRLRGVPRTFRFDVVEVALTPGEPAIRHFENIELFSKYFRG